MVFQCVIIRTAAMGNFCHVETASKHRLSYISASAVQRESHTLVPVITDACSFLHKRVFVLVETLVYMARLCKARL